MSAIGFRSRGNPASHVRERREGFLPRIALAERMHRPDWPISTLGVSAIHPAEKRFRAKHVDLEVVARPMLVRFLDQQESRRLVLRTASNRHHLDLELGPLQ